MLVKNITDKVKFWLIAANQLLLLTSKLQNRGTFGDISPLVVLQRTGQVSVLDSRGQGNTKIPHQS